jgi:hypothetical protein
VAKEMVANAVRDGKQIGDRAVQVVDETNTLAFAIEFRDATRL